MNFNKVFITTAGVGSKLGDLTNYMNKAMIKIGKKPVISYIIEQYPEDVEYVIALGYKGSHIKQFLKLAYPKRHFTFVDVNFYDGENASQVYSMYCCKQNLQEPFIYNDCDSISDDILQRLNATDIAGDFIAGYNFDDINGIYNYDSYDVRNTNLYIDKVTNLYHRETNIHSKYAYIGICGIWNYKYFWDSVENALINKTAKTDFDIFYNYYKDNVLYSIDVKNWTDTGTIDGILKARKQCKDKLDILDKNNQAIFILNKKVIKFFTDDNVVFNLINRMSKIGILTHSIVEYTQNFFTYNFIEGETAVNCINPVLFDLLINYFRINNLWECVPNINDFKQNQYKFYIEKTINRVNDFKTKYKISEDKDITINNIIIPKEYTVEYMLKLMQDQPEYINSNATNWHGDFTLENMIYNNATWTLIDCRDKFGDTIDYGDRLYDWGKINHNLTFNFASALNGQYKLNIDKDDINFSIMCDLEVYKCKDVLKKFVEAHNIRYDYIEFLSGLNWVNMSPLHPINNLPYLLFYMGKLQMYESIMKLTNNDVYIKI